MPWLRRLTRVHCCVCWAGGGWSHCRAALDSATRGALRLSAEAEVTGEVVPESFRGKFTADMCSGNMPELEPEEEARARSYLSSRRPVLLGMHACCATESIIVAALDAGLPCAVVPCCGEPPTHARISITLVGLSFAHPDRRVPLCSSARGTWRLCCVCRTSAGQRRRTTA